MPMFVREPVRCHQNGALRPFPFLFLGFFLPLPLLESDSSEVQVCCSEFATAVLGPAHRYSSIRHRSSPGTLNLG